MDVRVWIAILSPVKPGMSQAKKAKKETARDVKKQWEKTRAGLADIQIKDIFEAKKGQKG